MPPSLETNALLAPANAVAAAPACHVLVVWFTTVQLFNAKVAPVSKPPSPVGFINIV